MAKIKSYKWHVSFGILSIVTIFIFLKALNIYTDSFIEDNAKWVLFGTGFILIMLIVGGFLKIKRILRKWID